MCHTYIKEEILTYRLSHTYRHRIFQNSSIRKQNLALTQRCKDQYKDSCQCKTHTCKNDLTCRICRIHLHQTVSCLDQRDRTPPEKTADAGKRCHHPGFFNIVFVCSICLFSLSQNFFHLTDHSFYFIYCTDTYVPEINLFPLSV